MTFLKHNQAFIGAIDGEANSFYPSPKFDIGQAVTMEAFTDCFGKQHAAVSGTVSRMEFVHSSFPFWRVRMDTVGGYHEAAERFFAATT